MITRIAQLFLNVNDYFQIEYIYSVSNTVFSILAAICFAFILDKSTTRVVYS